MRPDVKEDVVLVGPSRKPCHQVCILHLQRNLEQHNINFVSGTTLKSKAHLEKVPGIVGGVFGLESHGGERLGEGNTHLPPQHSELGIVWPYLQVVENKGLHTGQPGRQGNAEDMRGLLQGGLEKLDVCCRQAELGVACVQPTHHLQSCIV